MASNRFLTAVQCLWQVRYIKLTVRSRLRARCDFWGVLIATALQSVLAFRVSGGDIFYLCYTLFGPWRTSWCCVVASLYHEFVIGSFFIVLVHLTIVHHCFVREKGIKYYKKLYFYVIIEKI